VCEFGEQGWAFVRSSQGCRGIARAWWCRGETRRGEILMVQVEGEGQDMIDCGTGLGNLRGRRCELSGTGKSGSRVGWSSRLSR
jgi:hypothetical protein